MTKETTVATIISKTAKAAAKIAEKKCGKCAGSGVYRWGVFTTDITTNKTTSSHAGVCYECGGKGYRTAADVKRCDNYWNYYARV